MKKIILPLIALLPSLAYAHEGHGHFNGHTLIHYFTSAEHAIPLAVIAVFGLFLAYRSFRKGKTAEETLRNQ